ncbi:MAG: hypothetical protein EOM21_18625 [Gammaproteobacteria bacterium]|nr:hypothetical protein [Gammaproteobacteria bacterium]
MTEDRIRSLESSLDELRFEHQRHEELLDHVAKSVSDILTNMHAISSALAAHTTIEAAHHADRSKLFGRLILAISGLIIGLAAIYSAVTGVPLHSAILPMIRSLLGL